MPFDDSIFQFFDGNTPKKAQNRSLVRLDRSGKFDMPENLTDDCKDLIAKMLIVNPKKEKL